MERSKAAMQKLNCIGRIHMRLKYKLMLSTVGTISVGTILAVASIASLLITSFPDWTESTKDRMLEAEESSLIRLVREKAEFADLFYKRVGGSLDGLCTYAQDIDRGAVHTDGNTIDLEKDAAMSMDAFVRIRDDEPGWDSEKEWNINFSGWYACKQNDISSPCEPISDFNELTPTDQSLINGSEPLRLMYRGMWESDFPYHSGGFFSVNYESEMADQEGTSNGFDTNSVADSNLVHWYPYFDAITTDNSFAETKIEDCKLAGGPVSIEGFTPFCRAWYANAVENPDVTRIQYTPPYNFAGSQNLGVTASRRLFSYSDSTNPGVQAPNGLSDPLGVCMVDFVNQELDDSIANQGILNDGFGFMITDDGEHTVLFRDIEFTSTPTEPGPIWDWIFEEGDDEDEERIEFKKMVEDSIVGSSQGNGEYKKDGKNWFIAWHEVPEPGYIVGLTVPEDDVREPVDDAESEINAVVGTLIGVSVAVFLVIFVTVFYLTKRLAGSIVEPIYLLTQLIKKINTREFSKGEQMQSFLEVTDPKFVTKELASLDAIFRQMFTAVRAGEGSIIKGELREAENVFEEAMELFQRLGHLRGLGVCYTNLGAVYLMNGYYDKSVTSFRSAVQNATDLLEHSQVGGPVEEDDDDDDDEKFSEANPIGDRSQVKASSRGVLKRSQTTQFARMLRDAQETIQFRRINLAKALLARAKNTVKVHCPTEYFAAYGEKCNSAAPASSSEEALKAAVKDLKEVAKLGMESLSELAKAKAPRVKLLDARSDVLRALVEAMECEAIVLSKLKAGKDMVVGSYYKAQADEELAKMLQDIQVVWQEENNKSQQLYTRAKDKEQKKNELQNAKQFAQAAHARFLLAENQPQHSVTLLSHIFTTSKKLGGGVMRLCADDMALALHRMGRHEMSKAVKQEAYAGMQPPRNFCFLLDTSGSMSNLIHHAVNNLARLYDNHVKAKDSLTVFTFDTTARCVLPKRKKGAGRHADQLRADIKSLTRVGGLTACYDSIWLALDELKDADNKTEDIIVCLTDGSDNRSRHRLSELCDRIQHEYYDRVMVCIVALGNLQNREDLKRITRSSKSGAFIEAAAGLEEMDEAFEQVSQAIANISVRLESM